MKLTQKLLGLLHRVFDPDPERFLALRIAYNGGSLKWAVSDCVLTTEVAGGSGSNLTVDLRTVTLRDLVNFISAQPGYSVPSASASKNLSLGARVLIDGSGDASQSNGDHLYAYSSLTWVYLETIAAELGLAKKQIPEAIKQMAITTAQDDWLDELGGYYGIPRQQGELDASYGPRIIAEVVRPRSNNVAMEAAISYYTGQSTKVTDVVVYGDIFPLYNSAIMRNGEYLYQTGATPRYGLFDVEYGYDLLGGSDLTEFAHRIRQIIDKLRAAGTHLRALSLKAGVISDAFTEPVDDDLRWVVRPGLIDTAAPPSEIMDQLAALSIFTDTLNEPVDTPSMSITYNYRYDSTRTRNSAIRYLGGLTITE